MKKQQIFQKLSVTVLAGAVGLLLIQKAPARTMCVQGECVRGGGGRVEGVGLRGGLSSFDPAPFHLLSLSFTTMHIIKCNNLCKQRLKFLPRWRAGKRERVKRRERDDPMQKKKKKNATYPQGKEEGKGGGAVKKRYAF